MQAKTEPNHPIATSLEMPDNPGNELDLKLEDFINKSPIEDKNALFFLEKAIEYQNSLKPDIELKSIDREETKKRPAKFWAQQKKTFASQACKAYKQACYKASYSADKRRPISLRSDMAHAYYLAMKLQEAQLYALGTMKLVAESKRYEGDKHTLIRSLYLLLVKIENKARHDTEQQHNIIKTKVQVFLEKPCGFDIDSSDYFKNLSASIQIDLLSSFQLDDSLLINPVESQSALIDLVLPVRRERADHIGPTDEKSLRDFSLKLQKRRTGSEIIAIIRAALHYFYQGKYKKFLNALSYELITSGDECLRLFSDSDIKKSMSTETSFPSLPLGKVEFTQDEIERLEIAILTKKLGESKYLPLFSSTDRGYIESIEKTMSLMFKQDYSYASIIHLLTLMAHANLKEGVKFYTTIDSFNKMYEILWQIDRRGSDELSKKRVRKADFSSDDRTELNRLELLVHRAKIGLLIREVIETNYYETMIKEHLLYLIQAYEKSDCKSWYETVLPRLHNFVFACGVTAVPELENIKNNSYSSKRFFKANLSSAQHDALAKFLAMLEDEIKSEDQTESEDQAESDNETFINDSSNNYCCLS